MPRRQPRLQERGQREGAEARRGLAEQGAAGPEELRVMVGRGVHRRVSESGYGIAAAASAMIGRETLQSARSGARGWRKRCEQGDRQPGESLCSSSGYHRLMPRDDDAFRSRYNGMNHSQGTTSASPIKEKIATAPASANPVRDGRPRPRPGRAMQPTITTALAIGTLPANTKRKSRRPAK